MITLRISLNISCILILTESVSYEFGTGRGMILYQFPPGNQPDTEEDNIALGFVTTRADAVLLRIDSSNTQDYFELEIVSRRIYLGMFSSKASAACSSYSKTQLYVFHRSKG